MSVAWLILFCFIRGLPAALYNAPSQCLLKDAVPWYKTTRQGCSSCRVLHILLCSPVNRTVNRAFFLQKCLCISSLDGDSLDTSQKYTLFNNMPNKMKKTFVRSTILTLFIPFSILKTVVRWTYVSCVTHIATHCPCLPSLRSVRLFQRQLFRCFSVCFPSFCKRCPFAL